MCIDSRKKGANLLSFHIKLNNSFLFLRRKWGSCNRVYRYTPRSEFILYYNVEQKKIEFDSMDHRYNQKCKELSKIKSCQQPPRKRLPLSAFLMFAICFIFAFLNVVCLGRKLHYTDGRSPPPGNLKLRPQSFSSLDKHNVERLHDSSDNVLKPSSISTLISLFQNINPQEPIQSPSLSPDQKVSVILMNYSRPRMIQESSLMDTLIQHPNVGEIMILHANPNTRFDYMHEKVFNIDATEENDSLGLSLRFYFSQMVTYDWVLHVDDDMEFEPEVLTKMLLEFQSNTKRIVGRFGRNIHRNRDSYWNWCARWYNGYSSVDTHLKSDVILTKFMVMERELSKEFFEYAHLIWDDIILKQGEGPLWNGEDIFMSLIANHVYGSKNNYAMDWLEVRDAPESLKDYKFGKFDVSGGHMGLSFWSWEWWQSLLRRNRHYSYRGMLWQVAESRLNKLSQNGFLNGGVDGLSSQEELDKLRI